MVPRLAVALPQKDGWVWKTGRDHAPRQDAFNAMYGAHGPLVMLTLSLDTLDPYPIKSQDVADGARSVSECAISEMAPGAPYTADVQRGRYGGTHVHIILPLAFLLDRDAITAAPMAQVAA